MLPSAFIPFSAQGDLFVSAWHLVYSLVVQWLHCRLYTGSLTFVAVIKKTFPCCFLHCFKAICKLKSEENATGCLLSSLSGGKQSGGLCPVPCILCTKIFARGVRLGASPLPDFHGVYVSSFSALAALVVLLHALWALVAVGRELWRQLRMT